jgi:hypothetical protein
MATVFLARDERHNRNVALKVLKPELAAVVGADRFSPRSRRRRAFSTCTSYRSSIRDRRTASSSM